jgi:hypothetical protein
MEEFMSFKRMITPTIIRVLFWIVAGISVIAGLVSIAAGEVWAGAGIALVGPLLARVYCELLILFFRMNETLNEISHSVRQGSRAAL